MAKEDQNNVSETLEQLSELFNSFQQKLFENLHSDSASPVMDNYDPLEGKEWAIHPGEVADLVADYISKAGIQPESYGVNTQEDVINLVSQTLEAPDPEKYLREYFSEENEVGLPGVGDSSQPDQKDWRTDPPPVRDDVFSVPIEYEDYQESSEQTYADTSNTVIPTAPSQEDDSTEIADALERLIEGIDRLSEKIDELSFSKDFDNNIPAIPRGEYE